MGRGRRLSFGTYALLLSWAGAASSVHAQTGACCLDGGFCFSLTQAQCVEALPPGAYQGDGSACPGLCGQQGACCFTDGSCDALFYGPCNTSDGTFQGDATVCLPNPCPPLAPVPTQINHQGVVSVNGQRFNGNGSFYFAIIDPATGNSVWTNDATNIGTANRPNQPVTIACENGLYDVRLGDLISYGDMKPIPVDVFSSPNRTLRIWFNDGTNGVFQLTPDHALTSTPYAYRAAEATNGIPSGAIVMWSGSRSSIPPGWALCDGTNGTPDLQDRFVLGTRIDEEPGETGGSTTHSHLQEYLNRRWKVISNDLYPNLSSVCSVWNLPDYQTDPRDVVNPQVQIARIVGSPGPSVDSIWNPGDPFPDANICGTGTDPVRLVRWHGVYWLGTDTQTHIPPYFRVAFIMKLP